MPLGLLGQTCLQQVHVQQTTPHQKPFPHGEHTFSSVLRQGVCYGLSFNEGKLKFVHFGGSYTNTPAPSTQGTATAGKTGEDQDLRTEMIYFEHGLLPGEPE